MPAEAHIQAATLQNFLAAWKSWNAESWLAVFDDSFEHITMPLNLGLPPKSKAEVAATLPTMMSAIKDCQVLHRIRAMRSVRPADSQPLVQCA